MNSLSSGRAPKQRAEDRRRTILAGASSVFAGASFAQADTGDLAAAAGVTPPALYRYFPTKRHLYLATLADAGPKLLELWQRALSAAPDPASAIKDIGMAYYGHARSRSPIMRLWFQAVGEAADPEVRALVAETLGKAVGLVQAVIEDGQRAGVFRDDMDTRTAAWEFMGIGFSMDLAHVLGFGDDLSRETVEEMGDRFIDSLRPRADTATTGRGVTE